MTKHQPAPSCDCDDCFVADVVAVATAYRNIRELNSSPLAALPGWDIAARRFLHERRETGKPPVDPDAEQLAADVREIVAEMEGGQ